MESAGEFLMRKFRERTNYGGQYSQSDLVLFKELSENQSMNHVTELYAGIHSSQPGSSPSEVISLMKTWPGWNRSKETK